MYTFYFACDGKKDGYPSYTEQKYTHETEEQARRELIYILNGLHNFNPKKIKLIKIEKFEENIWSQLN